MVRQEVIEKIRLTPAELRSYYNKQRQRFYRPERVKVRHIAVGNRSLYNRVMNLLERKRKFTSLVRKGSPVQIKSFEVLVGGLLEPGKRKRRRRR